MKGKIMTTENTTATEIETPEQIAEQFVKNHNSMQIEEELVNHYKTIESLKDRVQRLANEVDTTRAYYRTKIDAVEEFLKEHIKNDDEPSIGELKELAAELDIEMTKTIKVTFDVEVEVEMTVDIDFDEDTIREHHFTVSAEFDGMNDVEVDDTTIDISNYNVQED